MKKNDRQIEGIRKMLTMGARRFQAQSKQFEARKQRMDRVEATLANVSDRLVEISGKIDILVDAQIRTDERLGRVEKKPNGHKRTPRKR